MDKKVESLIKGIGISQLDESREIPGVVSSFTSLLVFREGPSRDYDGCDFDAVNLSNYVSHKQYDCYNELNVFIDKSNGEVVINAFPLNTKVDELVDIVSYYSDKLEINIDDIHITKGFFPRDDMDNNENIILTASTDNLIKDKESTLKKTNK